MGLWPSVLLLVSGSPKKSNSCSPLKHANVQWVSLDSQSFPSNAWFPIPFGCIPRGPCQSDPKTQSDRSLPQSVLSLPANMQRKEGGRQAKEREKRLNVPSCTIVPWGHANEWLASEDSQPFPSSASIPRLYDYNRGKLCQWDRRFRFGHNHIPSIQGSRAFQKDTILMRRP